jgi:hypothetical protein
MRRVVRMVAYIRGLAEHGIVCFEKVSSEEQRADGLSKQYKSPVKHADAMARVLGEHPEITAFRQRVHDKCDKRSKGQKRPKGANGDNGMDLGYEDGEVMEEAAYVAWAQGSGDDGVKARAVGTMQQTVPFLNLGKDFSARMMAGMGYSGSGGLGRKGEGIEKALEVAMRPKGQGLGFVIGTADGSTGGVTFVRGGGRKEVRGGVRAYVARPEEIVTVVEGEEPVFLAERIRRALQKLTMEERWLFNTRLRDGPFHDMLLSQEQLHAEMKGERPVMARRALQRPDGRGDIGDGRDADVTRGDGPFQDMFPSQEQLQAERNGERPVLAQRAGPQPQGWGGVREGFGNDRPQHGGSIATTGVSRGGRQRSEAYKRGKAARSKSKAASVRGRQQNGDGSASNRSSSLR